MNDESIEDYGPPFGRPMPERFSINPGPLMVTAQDRLDWLSARYLEQAEKLRAAEAALRGVEARAYDCRMCGARVVDLEADE